MSNTLAARVLATLSLCSLALVLVASPDAGAKSPSQAAVARQLARDVAKGSTPAVRQAALLKIFRTLQVTVIDARGRAKAGAFARSRVDPLLYDFEVRSMVAAPPSTSTREVESLAAALAARLKAGAVPPEQLARALQSAVASATRRQRDPNSFALLVIRELGLAHQSPVDLARSVPLDRVKLDRVQETLLLVSVASASRSLAGPAPTARASSGPGDVCDVWDRWSGHTVAPLTKWGGAGKTVAEYIQRALTGSRAAIKMGGKAAALAIAGAGIDVVHAFTLAAGIDFTIESEAAQATHYGPAAAAAHPDAGARPGAPMKFTIRLVSAFPDKEAAVIKCGPLVGFTLPAKGGIPGVEVHWDRMFLGDYAVLERHGKIAAQTRTDADGYASLTFTPNDERNPGAKIIETKGTLRPSVDLYTAVFNLLGLLGSDSLGLRFKTFNWRVEQHDEQLFEVRFEATQRDDWKNYYRAQHPTNGGVVCEQRASGAEVTEFFDAPNARPLVTVARTDDGSWTLKPITTTWRSENLFDDFLEPVTGGSIPIEAWFKHRRSGSVKTLQEGGGGRCPQYPFDGCRPWLADKPVTVQLAFQRPKLILDDDKLDAPKVPHTEACSDLGASPWVVIYPTSTEFEPADLNGVPELTVEGRSSYPGRLVHDFPNSITVHERELVIDWRVTFTRVAA